MCDIPAAGQVIIDSEITEKPGMFQIQFFIQSLLPSNHSVLIEKMVTNDSLNPAGTGKPGYKIRKCALDKKNL